MHRQTPGWIRVFALCFVFALMLLGVIRYSLTSLSLHFLVNPTLDYSNMITYEGQRVRICTQDHLMITGLFFPPRRPHTPAVIICHGSGQTIRSTARIAHWLYQKGFAVLTFDYRGFGESQGQLRSYRDLTHDLQSALAFLVQQKKVDTDRIGLMGLSLGTAPAVQIASSDRRIKALLLQGAVYSGEQILMGIFPDPWIKFCAKYLIDLNGLNNCHAIRRLNCPLFIIQEGEDWITLPQDGARLYEIAPGPKSFWYVPQAGHLDTVLHYPAEYRTKVTQFFAEALKK